MKNLTASDQQRAKDELLSLKTQKEDALGRALLAAYGVVRSSDEGQIDPSRRVQAHLIVLRRGVKPWMPPTADFKSVLQHATAQLFDAKHPRHPQFADEIKLSKLNAELGMLRRLADQTEARLALDKGEAHALDVANALGLVRVLDGAATTEHATLDEWQRAISAQGITTPDFGRMRGIVSPDERGLTRDVQDFAISAFAVLRGRELIRHGKPFDDDATKLGKFPDDVELTEPHLPGEVEWQRALDVAAKVFGIAIGGRARNIGNMRALSKQVLEKGQAAQGANGIAALLERRAVPSSAPRVQTAIAAGELLDHLGSKDPLVATLALSVCQPKTTSLEAMARHFLAANETSAALSNELSFQTFQTLTRGAPSDRQRDVLLELKDALSADELNVSLAEALKDLAMKAQKIVEAQLSREVLPPSQPPLAAEPLAKGEQVVAGHDTSTLTSEGDLEIELQRIRAAFVSAGMSARLSVSWKVFTKEDA